MATLSPRVTFKRMQQGLCAAQAGNEAFLAVRSPTGGLRVLSGRTPQKPMSFWREADFPHIIAHLETEAAFRAHVRELLAHRQECANLHRQQTRMAVWTPWGSSQSATIYGKGIVCHQTASHGGFHLDDAANGKVPAPYRNAGGWYEEDSEWAKVAAAFPDLFTGYERKCADRTLRDAEPDAYETVTGVSLEPGESRTKDARRFAKDHANDWIVISASLSKSRPGFIDCLATRGGQRDFGDARRFLVPAVEYHPGPHSFVIDQDRHKPRDAGDES